MRTAWAKRFSFPAAAGAISQTSTRTPQIICPEIRISANRRSRATRPTDFIALVEKHGIAYHEKKLGQLFCDFSSRQIVELLQNECETAQVEIRLNCRVTGVQQNPCFQLETSQGAFESDSLVIATGGLSFTQTWAPRISAIASPGSSDSGLPNPAPDWCR